MSRTRKIGVPTVVLLGALAVAGCSSSAFTIDPYKREGIWKPSGVNDTNLAAHVANPTDLARGREDARGSRRTPVVAVERLWSGAPPARAAQASQSGQGGAAGAQQAPR